MVVSIVEFLFHAIVGALEGAKFVQTGELVALSEQNLLDCDHKDLGCNGGL